MLYIMLLYILYICFIVIRAMFTMNLV